ncbi:methyltransferase domain-containing protein [Sphingomonas sp. H39-1-10]|uniref:class I SAM-dependent methyltransferase n=1 Tax=Sphingomonas TaxID=13687 RepID=UPI0008897CF9|nr:MULTISPECIES: class I SAM-dependent methyltransferase [Sphingomonas]MDF0489568.1 methyltransferase domain-containing protein [Sphingomonas pollutisoli]SDA28524.1 Methyltransferase domain-containing protein [Sphingomonas sp. NFR15]
MLITNLATISDLLACPACGARLDVPADDGPVTCAAVDCPTASFDQVGGQDVLIEFSGSVLDRETMLATGGASVWKRDRLRWWFGRIVYGINPIARHFARTVIAELERSPRERPLVLVIGGGAIGSRAEPLYESDKVGVVAFDIYASPNITFLADAHRIPLKDTSVDAVWIQAVLELTVDPIQVVSEIRRVLRPGGQVFATTAYLWSVCEGAYDYSRWTPSGLRWMFRHFDVLALGSASGLGTGVLLALRALAQSLLRSKKAGHVATLPFFWLRFLDRFTGTRVALDAAPALFFHGRLADQPIDVPELVRFYDDQIALEREGRRVREG